MHQFCYLRCAIFQLTRNLINDSILRSLPSLPLCFFVELGILCTPTHSSTQEPQIRAAGIPLVDGAGSKKSYTLKGPTSEASSIGILFLGIFYPKLEKHIYHEKLLNWCPQTHRPGYLVHRSRIDVPIQHTTQS